MPEQHYGSDAHYWRQQSMPKQHSSGDAFDRGTVNAKAKVHSDAHYSRRHTIRRSNTLVVMQRSMQKQHFNGDANYLQQLSMLKQHSLAMHIIYGNTTCQSNTPIVMTFATTTKYANAVFQFWCTLGTRSNERNTLMMQLWFKLSRATR